MHELISLVEKNCGIEFYPVLKAHYGGLLNPNLVSCLLDKESNDLIISFWEHGKLRTECCGNAPSPYLFIHLFEHLDDSECSDWFILLKKIGFFASDKGVVQVLEQIAQMNEMKLEKLNWQEKWDYAVWSIEGMLEEVAALSKAIVSDTDWEEKLAKQAEKILCTETASCDEYDNLLEEIKAAKNENSLLTDSYDEYVLHTIFDCYQKLLLDYQREILLLSTYNGDLDFYGDGVISLSELSEIGVVNMDVLLKRIAKRLFHLNY